MFASVKNKFKRTKLVKVLSFIVSSTQSPAGFGMAPEKDVAEIAAAEPSFLIVDSSVKDAAGNVKASATPAGIAASQGEQAAAAAAPAAAPKVEFTIEAGIVIPPSKRGGKKSDIYPFEKLEVNQSFLVPASADRPNPAKSLASTVSSATKRYAVKTGEQETVVVKGKTITRDKMKLVRQFTVRAVEGGARIWRTA